MLDMLHDTEDEPQQPQPMMQGQNFRDVFLQSQNRLQATAVGAVDGMKSAWQDFDAATGLGSKLKQLPTFLPDTAVLEAAEEEERLLRTAAHRIQPRQQQQQQRPTSILGGFVRSLAQSVLPDEDPTLYQHWKAPPLVTPVPQFYNQETPPSKQKPTVLAAPQLYVANLDHAVSETTTTNKLKCPSPSVPLSGSPTTGQAAPTGIPRLYNKETPPSKPKIAVQAAPQLYMREPAKKVAETAVEDGWDDGSDGIGSEVGDDIDNDDDAVAVVVLNQSATPVKVAEDPLKNWVYDPVTDIIPTRKRWVNPRHGSRELHSVTLRPGSRELRSATTV